MVENALGYKRNEGVFLAAHVAANPVEFEQGVLEDCDKFFNTFCDEFVDLVGCVRHSYSLVVLLRYVSHIVRSISRRNSVTF